MIWIIIRNSSLFVDRIQYSKNFAKYEILKGFKNPGSIIECGVKEGSGLMLFAKLSAILNLTILKEKLLALTLSKDFLICMIKTNQN